MSEYTIYRRRGIKIPAELHESTAALVIRFAEALAAKLRKAELKHGYSDHWRSAQNVDFMKRDLAIHILKGDPLDVAAYCAFLWHHDQSTKPRPPIARPLTEWHADHLDQPLRWIAPRRVFVNSTSDLFHERVPFQFIADVFATMSVTTRHTYQVLSKRPEIILQWLDWLRGEIHDDYSPDESKRLYRRDHHDWPSQVDSSRVWPEWRPWREGKTGGYDNCGPTWPLTNVILGASIENAKYAAERFPMLREIADRGWRTMVSIEPLLDAVTIPDDYLALGQRAWVIVGGESGPRARPMNPKWVRALRDQCAAAGVPFFFKQWGEWLGTLPEEVKPAADVRCHEWNGGMSAWRVGKKAAGRLLDGREHNEFPNGEVR